MVEILDMSAGEAEEFFSGCPKIRGALHAMVEVGLSYLSLGQPLSTLSGGERQRVKLAKYLGQKGNIYVLDKPTTGLHASDVETIITLLERFVERGIWWSLPEPHRRWRSMRGPLRRIISESPCGNFRS